MISCQVMRFNVFICCLALILTYKHVESSKQFEKLNILTAANKSCPALNITGSHLQVSCNHNNSVGSFCNFTCDSNSLQLNGSSAITCLGSGQWNATQPQCISTGGWQGFVGAIVAVVFFGSNFIPVKKFETGDGMFFQWVLCSAIWITGLVTNCLNGFPAFYPLAMLGGFLWATGNICVVPIIKTIGLGLGMLIWGSFNLLAGWSSGRFGWFGLEPEIPNNTTLNYIAIAFAMMSTVFWLFVKPDVSGDSPDSQPAYSDYDEGALYPEAVRSGQTDRLLSSAANKHSSPMEGEDEQQLLDSTTSQLGWEDKMSPKKKRILGVFLSMFSGILYGLSFTPVIYVKEKYKDEGAPQHDIDYVFAHFSGIYATSTFYFIVYCIIKKNKPDVYPMVIVPGMVSGVMWAVADTCWFIANNYLSEAVSFPIITTGPGIIASLWGVLLFREVKGMKNYLVMAVAYTFTITGAVLAGLSKK